VKTSRAKTLRNRKRRIERRLDPNRSRAQRAKPMIDGTGLRYSMSERIRGVPSGGVGLMLRLAIWSGLREALDENLSIFKRHLPYHESDHVLTVALNILAGGRSLEDIELIRNNENFLDLLGAERLPDPTTVGDFCRRFTESRVDCLMDTVNDVRKRIWRSQPD